MNSENTPENTDSTNAESLEATKRETNVDTVADFLAEKYDLKVVSTPDDLEGVTMFLQKEGCEIRVSFYSYAWIADIDVENGDRLIIEEIVADLKKEFNFIDQEYGTVNKGNIRLCYHNPVS